MGIYVPQLILPVLVFLHIIPAPSAFTSPGRRAGSRLRDGPLQRLVYSAKSLRLVRGKYCMRASRVQIAVHVMAAAIRRVMSWTWKVGSCRHRSLIVLHQLETLRCISRRGAQLRRVYNLSFPLFVVPTCLSSTTFAIYAFTHS